MLYRRSAQLALESALLLALEPAGTCRRVKEIAAALGVPATYLAKILQNLTRVGFLRGVRGPGGGVRLAQSARHIRLWDLLIALEPVDEFERCFLKLQRCDDLRPCPLHQDWAPIRAQIRSLLQTKTLWEVATEAQRRGILAGKPPRDGDRRSRPAARKGTGKTGTPGIVSDE